MLTKGGNAYGAARNMNRWRWAVLQLWEADEKCRWVFNSYAQHFGSLGTSVKGVLGTNCVLHSGQRELVRNLGTIWNQYIGVSFRMTWVVTTWTENCVERRHWRRATFSESHHFNTIQGGIRADNAFMFLLESFGCSSWTHRKNLDTTWQSTFYRGII